VDVDISVIRLAAGGTLLRVVLYRETGTEPEGPRRFQSGIRRREDGAITAQAALAFAARGSS
jgi:hypothetical protein